MRGLQRALGERPISRRRWFGSKNSDALALGGLRLMRAFGEHSSLERTTDAQAKYERKPTEKTEGEGP
jgi:hypothetical protein